MNVRGAGHDERPVGDTIEGHPGRHACVCRHACAGANLIDYLKHGHPLEEFLDDFPTVRKEQAEAALDIAKQALVS